MNLMSYVIILIALNFLLGIAIGSILQSLGKSSSKVKKANTSKNNTETSSRQNATSNEDPSVNEEENLSNSDHNNGIEIEQTKLSMFNFSSVIGFCERLIYTYCFASGDNSLFAAVIAFKTLMRFPEATKGSDSELTSEKYILGTLINIVVALIFTYFYNTLVAKQSILDIIINLF